MIKSFLLSYFYYTTKPILCQQKDGYTAFFFAITKKNDIITNEKIWEGGSFILESNRRDYRDEFESKENRILSETQDQYEKAKKGSVGRYKKRKKRRRRGIVFTFLFLILALIVGCGLYIYSLLKDDIQSAIQLGYDKIETLDVDTFHTRYNSVLLDDQGNVLKEFKGRDYIYKTYDEMNPQVLDATIAIEDERFYQHQGIDLRSLVRAGYYTIFKGQTQGGSTITTQLAKNIFMSEVMTEKTIYRKITEWVIAQELEKRYSKEEILEFYVNNINYGSGCYSVATAADYYFQKDTNDLTLAECALLAGIPNNPSLYSPISQPENAVKRRDLILDKMLELGMISEQECKDAKAESLQLNVKEVYMDNSVTGWGETFAMHKATQELMKTQGFLFQYRFQDEEEQTWYEEQYDLMYEECYQMLINGGYRIQTSINQEKQQKLQEIVDSHMSRYTSTGENGLYSKQSSAVVIDNATGLVVAIVGGRTQEGNTYNRAFLSARQPGSSIKPLIAYTPAYENGYYPEMGYSDTAIENGPKNAYSGYIGDTTLRYATEISINTIPYRLVNELGVENCLQKLTSMHFSHLDQADYESPIVAVGGFTYGVTNVELTSGFATLANNGKYIEPTNVTEIRKISNDTIVYENKQIKTTVYSAGAAYLTTNTLEGVLKSDHGTARGSVLSYPYQAGKTGTTDSAKDVWMAGYTPYYSMSVWVGDDTPTVQYGVGEQQDIWHDYMEWLHQGLEEKGWSRPDTVYEDNGVLKVRIDTRLQDMKNARLAIEAERKAQEIQEQKDRLADLDYRLVYGLTEEEEMEREKTAEQLIQSLENIRYTSLSQKEQIHNLYDKIEVALENVKRASAKAELTERYNSIRGELDDIEYQLELEEQRKRDLEEAKEQLTDYLNELDGLVNVSDYPSESRSEIQRILDDAREAMNDAISVSELQNILDSAKYSVSQYQTTAQIEAAEQSELATRKADVISQIDQSASSRNYRNEEWGQVVSLMTQAKNQINAITEYARIQEIDSIFTQFQTDLQQIPTKDQFETTTTTPPSSSETTQPESSITQNSWNTSSYSSFSN